MKIGIFGGTFDPFHQGHLKIAVEASKKLDKVIIVPTICDYYRPDLRKLFTFDEKCTIINQMISGVPNICISTIEKNQDSKWRTVNTVQYFKEQYPNDELYLIIGEDSYENFSTWFRYEDILLMATLMVVQRGNDSKDDLVKTTPCEELYIGKDFLEASSSKVRNKLISELMEMYLDDADWYNKL